MVKPLEYPSLLRPNTTETLLLAGQPVAVPKVELALREWQGPPIADTFGGKKLIDFAGRPLFAELCVYELFRLSGWNARWVETYGAPATQPKMLTAWLDIPSAQRKQQPHVPLSENEATVAGALAAIAAANNGSYAGCWDVLGWNGPTLIFAELKRYKRDRLQATQPAWLAAGLAAGLQPANFLLVEWDFLP